MEYERSRRIYASEGDVFAFISNIGNLPNYLPTIQSAEWIAEDRVRLRGKNKGAAFEDDAWLHVDPDRHRLEWSNDERTYNGSMTVSGNGDGVSKIVVHLSLVPYFAPSGRPLTSEQHAEPDPIDEGLETSLDSLRNLIEGTGGKKQPSITM